MIDLKTHIQSLRETMHTNYVRPDVALVHKYQKLLVENPGAMAYLEKRGLTQKTIEHFRLGYSSDYDAISIPIFKENNLVNIKYRFLNPKDAKYMGERGAETWIFNEAGIAAGIKAGKLLVVEGEFDCMCAWQAGIPNVVSPASGKESYGVWIEELDKIPNIYIAYDNDSGGRETAKEMAARIGTDKSFDVKYPEGIKDANDYLLSYTPEQFKELIRTAPPFYSHVYKGMADIINSLRNKKDDTLKIPFLPKVEVEKDWLIVVSGKTNVGKTAYVLNVSDHLAKAGIPTLVMPFERGIESVGKRFLQVKFNKTIDEFKETTESEWDKMVEECIETPVYFALPKKVDIVDTIVKARRLFGTRVVIIDHLDYIVRHSTQSKEAEIGQTLQELKRVAEDNSIVMIVVSHIRKIDSAGSMLKKKPSIEDLKGSSSLYQDPECVVMLGGDGKEKMKVDIVKNKGEMTSQEFGFNQHTGRLSDEWGGL